MADVSVQMGVSGVGQFKAAMNEASASVKMLDTALKMNEQQLKSTGDKETYLQNKMVTLKAQIEAQTKVVKNAEAAWKTLLQNGADPMSKAAVEMQSKYYQANTALMQMTDSLKALESGETQAAEKADKLSSSLGGLNRTVSLEAVINGVGRVTTALENAGKRAVELGKALFDEIMDKAAWADDSATMAMMYGVDLDTFLKVQKLVQNGMDTSVDAILGSQQKLRKGIGSGADEIKNILLEMGLAAAGGKDGAISIIDKDSVDLFWEAGRALMAMGDEFKQEDYAQKLFGKSWRELIPLFTEFANQDEFRAGLDTVRANTEEEVSKLAELNDAVGNLQGNFDTLESKVMAGLAPALTAAADALSGLLGNILDYLDTPEGQQALKDMETAVSGLFSDLSKIDPEDVVQGFKGVFDSIVDGLKWLNENSGTVIGALEAIVVGWGGLTLFGGALQLLQLVNGISALTSGGAAAGAAAGSAWGGAFASAVMAAAPWLAGLITLLVPAGGAGEQNDSLFDEKTGQLTAAGWADFYNNSGSWQKTIEHVGNLFGDMGRILSDTNAINAMAAYQTYGDEERLIRELEALGYIRKLTDAELHPETEQGKGTDTTGLADPNKAYRKDPRTGKMMPLFDVQLPESGQTVGLTEEQLNAVERMWDAMRTSGDFTDEDWAAYENAFKGQNELFKLIDDAMNHLFQTNNMTEEDLKGLPEDFFTANIKPVLPEGAEEILQGQLNQMHLGVIVTPWAAEEEGEHANGLPYVPFDGYHAILHKGEQVVTARAVSNTRNYNSNLYVENMVMNNGQDAEGLAAKVAAAQRWTNRGYGG